MGSREEPVIEVLGYLCVESDVKGATRVCSETFDGVPVEAFGECLDLCGRVNRSVVNRAMS